MPNRTNLDALDVTLIPSGDRAVDRSQTPRLAFWLTAAVEHQANDLLLVAGAPPSLRINGRILTLGSAVLDGEEIAQAMLPALAPHARRQFNDTGIADGSLRSAEGGRVSMSTAPGKPSDASRVPIAELLLISYGARQHIRKNALQHLHQEIAMTRKSGSFSFEESLASLVRSGAIERQDALARAHHSEELQLLLGA